MAAITAPAPGAPHLSLRGLGLRRGERWLFRGLDLEVRRGEFLAVTGPSGAGKSSLVAALAGLLPASEGGLSWCDAAGAAQPPAALRGRLGLVFQDLRLVPTLPLLDNVCLARLGRHPWWRTLAGAPREGEARARALLGALGLAEVAERTAALCSGGEQQRAALARGLCLEPEAVLADEPVSALDPDGARRALGVLRDEARARGLTVVCVLHDRPHVEEFADRALVIDPALPAGFAL